MKKKIVEALKTKDVYKGLSDALLNRIAENLIAGGKVTDESEIEDAIGGLDLAKEIEAYADSRANDASKTAVRNYEKKHKLKDGKPESAKEDPKPEGAPKPEDEGSGDDTPAWAKQLLADNKSLRERLDKVEQDKQTSSRSAKLDAILKDAPEKLRTRWKKDYERLTFKDDDDFDAWLEESKTYVEDVSKDFAGKPKPPTAPKSSRGPAAPAASAGAKAYAASVAKQAETATPAISGLSTK